MKNVYVLCLANYEYECDGCFDILGVYSSKVNAEKEENRLSDIYTRYQAEFHAIRTQFPNRLLDGLSGAEGAIALEKHREERIIVDKEAKVCMEKYTEEVNIKGIHVGSLSNVTVLETPLIDSE